MRAAAEREDATEKSAVTPGPLAPARELLGEMLLEPAEPAPALKEFEATMKKEPNRFRALAGAAKAAAASGDRGKAAGYYAQLLKICARADAGARPELADARAFVTRIAGRSTDRRPTRGARGSTFASVATVKSITIAAPHATGSTKLTP